MPLLRVGRAAALQGLLGARRAGQQDRALRGVPAHRLLHDPREKELSGAVSDGNGADGSVRSSIRGRAAALLRPKTAGNGGRGVGDAGEARSPAGGRGGICE